MRITMAALLLAAVLPARGVAQEPARDPAVAVAERFLTALRLAQWDSAAALVSPAVPPGRMGAAQLEQIWGQITGQVGALQSVSFHQVVSQDSLRQVELVATFAQQKLTVRVAVTPSGVAGFWLQPAPAEADAGPPPYADATQYREEEVAVGEEPWRLPGTLTVPASPGRHPVVVLVHGSGPNDRDETVGAAKPFRDLAWGLASQGVAVLRYDKRTRVHGARFPRLGTVEEEVIEDALAALRLVRAHASVDATRVYLLGHSLGGMLGPEIAERDGALAGLVLLAAPARDLVTVVEAQLRYLATLPQNAGEAAQEQIRASLAALQTLRSDVAADTTLVMGAPVAYYRDLERRKPVEVTKRLRLPVLVLHGERDYQVPVEEHTLWQQGLAGRAATTLRLFPGLNHLFIAGSGPPTPVEYATPGHVSADVVQAIAEWIRR